MAKELVVVIEKSATFKGSLAGLSGRELTEQKRRKDAETDGEEDSFSRSSSLMDWCSKGSCLVK